MRKTSTHRDPNKGHTIRFHVAIPLISAAMLWFTAEARAQFATIIATHDNTLYEDPNGTLSNGLGQRVFVGTTANGSRRRAVLRFDLAGQVPPGTTITSAALSFSVSRVKSATPSMLSVHRLLAPWGEATSVAPGEEGMGTVATAGDATWIHASFPDVFWSRPGGDYQAIASGTTQVPGVGAWGVLTNPKLVSDVQRWLDQPESNAGWILIGEESSAGTAKRFDSAQVAQIRARPTLTVGYSNVSPAVSCRWSRVNAAVAIPQDVLTINGSAGSFQERIVQVAPGQSITIDMAASDSGPDPGPFVLYLHLGAPTSGTVVQLPQGFGAMCFGNPITGSVATKVWNNIGRRNRIGHPDFPSTPAPSTPVQAPSGTDQTVTATLQGILLDNGSRSDHPASVTNAVVLQVL